jgi:glutaredoxin
MDTRSRIVVYSAELCGDCQALKTWMEFAGIQFENRDIRKNPEHGAELAAKTGKEGVPYVIINGEWKKGYEPGRPFSESFARELFGV